MSANADTTRLQSLLCMLQADPANSVLRSHCINTALALGDYQQAQQLVDDRLRHAPTDPHARKEYGNAIPQLDALLSNGHRQPGILVNLGLCHYCLAQFAAARAPLQEAYEMGERSAGLLRLWISTLHHLGMLDEALAAADTCGAAASSDGALAGVLALLYLDAEQAAAAARWAAVALEFNPSSVDGLVVQGMLHIAQMRTDEAKGQFERVLELAPRAGRAWLGLGTLALLAKDLGAAKELFEKALQHMGGHVGTLHMLAWTNFAAGDFAGAERSFTDALALNRNFAETHGGLAVLAAFRGEHSAAQRSIDIAERLDPECLSAKLARAVLAGADSGPELAQRMIAEAAGALAGNDSSALGRLLGSLIPR
jgi:tetratricopeptide (TPR) repeat protein